ncbi:MAG TPA: hypothetical protein VGA99_07125 [bacterium]
MKKTIDKTRAASFPTDAIAQAEVVQDGWSSVGERLIVPNLSLRKFLDKILEAKEYIRKAEELKLLRAQAIENRNRHLGEIWDLTKRIRNAAKATFGDYSPELECLMNSTCQLEHSEGQEQ